jgi:hypothetical protein
LFLFSLIFSAARTKTKASANKGNKREEVELSDGELVTQLEEYEEQAKPGNFH